MTRLRVLFLCCLLSLASPAWAQEAEEAPEPVATEAPRWTPSARGGRAAVEELATLYFPADQVPLVLRIARCETGGTYDLYAHSSGWDRRFGFYEHIGALQVSTVVWSAKAWELFGGSLWEPAVNFQMAAWIMAQYGPSHWPVCGR